MTCYRQKSTDWPGNWISGKKTLKMTQNYGKLLGGGRQSVDTRSTFGEPLKLKWVNYESANWLLSDFWAREPRLNRKIRNFDFWVFLVISFAWNKSLCHRYQIYMNLCEWHLLFVICKHYLAICHKWILFLEWGQVFSGHNQSAIYPASDNRIVFTILWSIESSISSIENNFASVLVNFVVLFLPKKVVF